MIAIGLISLSLAAILCGTALFAQHREHLHEQEMRGNRGRLVALSQRIVELELRRSTEFDPAAFEDLKTKVEALRLAQGLRSSGR